MVLAKISDGVFLFSPDVDYYRYCTHHRPGKAEKYLNVPAVNRYGIWIGCEIKHGVQLCCAIVEIADRLNSAFLQFC